MITCLSFLLDFKRINFIIYHVQNKASRWSDSLWKSSFVCNLIGSIWCLLTKSPVECLLCNLFSYNSINTFQILLQRVSNSFYFAMIFLYKFNFDDAFLLSMKRKNLAMSDNTSLSLRYLLPQLINLKMRYILFPPLPTYPHFSLLLPQICNFLKCNFLDLSLSW